MSTKQAVREELMTIKKKYKRFKNISTTFPYRFSIEYVPDQDLNVDFDGVKITFSIPEHYPDEAPNVDDVETATDGRAIPLAVRQHVKDYLNNLIKRSHQPGKRVLLSIMQFLERNIKSLITALPKFLQPYIIDEFDGSSKRRYAFVADIPIITKTTSVHKAKNTSSSSASDDSDNDEDDDEDDENEDDENEDDENEDNRTTLYSLSVQSPSLSTHAGPNDVVLVFEGVDLKGISVFECTELNLVTSCNRCNQHVDVKGLTPTSDFLEDCPNCNRQLLMRFYPHAVMSVSLQQQNIFAQVECSGCSLFDTLPTCQFAALCFECSYVNNIGSIKLRAANDIDCQHCHAKMSLVARQILKISVKQLAQEEETNARSLSTSQQAARKKKKKPVGAIGITPGLPLPKLGTCKHYKHSKRWLRFPCCGKAFSCDICHEENCRVAPDDVWANRMICGHCSTEQPVSGTCKICGKALTKKREPGESGAPKVGRSALKKVNNVGSINVLPTTKNKTKSIKRKI
jgi:hypothetical protein